MCRKFPYSNFTNKMHTNRRLRTHKVAFRKSKFPVGACAMKKKHSNRWTWQNLVQCGYDRLKGPVQCNVLLPCNSIRSSDIMTTSWRHDIDVTMVTSRALLAERACINNGGEWQERNGGAGKYAARARKRRRRLMRRSGNVHRRCIVRCHCSIKPQILT